MEWLVSVCGTSQMKCQAKRWKCGSGNEKGEAWDMKEIWINLRIKMEAMLWV